MTRSPARLLALVALLDNLGARSVSLRLVAFTTAAFLLGMRRTAGLKAGIEWHALLHALVVGLGALGCLALERHFEGGEDMGGAITLDYSRARGLTEEDARGMSEFHRSALCLGPLTSLHRIIPALTLGYSICDVLDSFKLGPAFLMHGVATSTVMGFFCEIGSSHVVTSMLLMELSTIILAAMRGTFYSPGVQVAVQLLFVVSFFVVRILWVPRIWWNIAIEMNKTRGSDVDSCSLNVMFAVIVVFGVFFHSLNAYCK
uniref:TLC domain-containing protein n=1 Tax=Odontella aurita TaxID=265563 RepID=A0A7S4KBM9_9STRA|mmetsp:Transcript_8860/g.26549  ORF Transcript_8860/g.26549 Transcript_8860/m.26549 type:complete len:259 (+) Transcript_8860:216-992(+)